MKRGSSVLQPPSEAAKRHAHDARSLSVPDAHAQCTPDAAGSSPFPSATSLFSPDVSTKMASDLLIRLSEATQKAQMHPGSRAEAEQQEEPGLALSPDGPGASPEPPSLTNTPDGNNSTDTLASDLLRKLAERQDVHGHVVRLKEEEEPMEVDTVAQNQPVIEENRRLFAVKTEDQSHSGNNMAPQLHSGAKMVDQRLHGGSKMADSNISGGSKFQLRVKVEDHGMSEAKMEEHVLTGAKMEDHGMSGAKMEYHVLTGAKMEDHGMSGAKMEYHVLTGAKMEDHGMSGAKMEYHVLTGAKMEDHVLTRTKMEDHVLTGVKMEDHVLTGVKMEDHVLSRAKMEDGLLFKAGVAERSISGAQMSSRFVCGVKMEDDFPSGAKMENQLVSGAKMEEQLFFGAKMEEQCLRAVLWQDMSVNLASTLLHQLSERVSKSSSQLMDRMTPPTRSSPVLKGDQLCSPQSNLQDPRQETQTSRDQTTGCSYFYRCHVCGFETDGHALFQSHMTEHRQWEHGSFSLHCCVCDLSTNQEAEMRAHVDTHFQGDTGDIRCPVALPAASCSAPVVAMVTQPQQSSLEHRCRICQRLFPGQQELLVHFQGHRQGNQYRCDRCGHLTRTANKLVEHVRVHTGERPFTCTLCPYSAKRRDSLRLHCKVKHAAHAADVPADVHTHRSYVHGDNHRANKQVQRLHTLPSALSAAPASCRPPLHPSLTERAGWRDLSPLLPISTLLALKPRSASSSSTSSSSSSSSLSNKLSFLGYLGLTASL